MGEEAATEFARTQVEDTQRRRAQIASPPEPAAEGTPRKTQHAVHPNRAKNIRPRSTSPLPSGTTNTDNNTNKHLQCPNLHAL